MTYRKYHHDNIQTPWMSQPLRKSELNRLTITQLLVIAKQKRGIKKQLIAILAE